MREDDLAPATPNLRHERRATVDKLLDVELRPQRFAEYLRRACLASVRKLLERCELIGRQIEGRLHEAGVIRPTRSAGRRPIPSRDLLFIYGHAVPFLRCSWGGHLLASFPGIDRQANRFT